MTLLLLAVITGLASAKKDFMAVMVTDIGGLGDKGFNDGGWQGLQMAKEKLGIKVSVIESVQQTDYIANLTNAARNADVVVALGYLMTDAVSEVASRFPDTKFVLIDSQGKDLPNLASYQFRAGQSAYLAGIVAASVSKTKKVGMMEPMSIPPVIVFTAGYMAGVKTWNAATGDNVSVMVTAAGTFDDPARGKSLALSMIGRGVDVILCGANTGLGVIEAVKQKNADQGISPEMTKNGARPAYFAITADLDGEWIVPGQVLCSALKRIPEAVYGATKAAYDGKFKGGLQVVGYREDAAGLSPMKWTKSFVPDKALRLVQEAEELMAKGHPALDIPVAVSDAKAFADSFEVPPELLNALK